MLVSKYLITHRFVAFVVACRRIRTVRVALSGFPGPSPIFHVGRMTKLCVRNSGCICGCCICECCENERSAETASKGIGQQLIQRRRLCFPLSENESCSSKSYFFSGAKIILNSYQPTFMFNQSEMLDAVAQHFFSLLALSSIIL
jgi:hypothetical protein